jgi:hypothetical protein
MMKFLRKSKSFKLTNGENEQKQMTEKYHQEKNNSECVRDEGIMIDPEEN